MAVMLVCKPPTCTIVVREFPTDNNNGCKTICDTNLFSGVLKVLCDGSCMRTTIH